MFPGSPSPQRGEARWGAVALAVGHGRAAYASVSPLQPVLRHCVGAARFALPPAGGGQEQRSGTKSTKWDVLLQKSPKCYAPVLRTATASVGEGQCAYAVPSWRGGTGCFCRWYCSENPGVSAATKHEVSRLLPLCSPSPLGVSLGVPGSSPALPAHWLCIQLRGLPCPDVCADGIR